MSLSNVFIKFVGIVLVLVGLALVLSAIGIHLLPVLFINELWSVILGIILIAVGAVLVRGGPLTL